MIPDALGNARGGGVGEQRCRQRQRRQLVKSLGVIGLEVFEQICQQVIPKHQVGARNSVYLFERGRPQIGTALKGSEVSLVVVLAR